MSQVVGMRLAHGQDPAADWGSIMHTYSEGIHEPEVHAPPADRSAWLASILCRQQSVHSSLNRQAHPLRRSAILLGLFLLFAAALLGHPSIVQAAEIQVADGEVAVADNGLCSLIEAIVNANDTATGLVHNDCAAGNPAGADTIILPAEGFFQPESWYTTTYNATALPHITSPITIEGNGATLSMGGRVMRFVVITETGSLTMTSAVMEGGRSLTYGGGAILNMGGTLVLDSCTLFRNRADWTGGGAVRNYHGDVAIVNSTFVSNQAEENALGGGAILNQSGALTVDNTTISANSAGNSGFGGGGILDVYGETTLRRSIVSGNDAFGLGDEIYDRSAVESSPHSIVGDDYNVVGHAGITAEEAFSGFVPGATDFDATSSSPEATFLSAIIDPVLRDAPGATPTLALVDGSPAVDFAPSAECVAQPTANRDQRNFTRNFDASGAGSGSPNLCDSGAYERHTARWSLTKTATPEDGTVFPFVVHTGPYLQTGIWGSASDLLGEFFQPDDVAVDDTGNIFVADTGNARIVKIDKTGTFVAQWGSRGTRAGQFLAPTALVVDVSGNVFVADYALDRIQKFDNEGKFIAQWGHAGSDPGEFDQLTGLGTDALGNIYTVERSPIFRVQKFDNNGAFLMQFGSQGDGDGQFQQPSDAAVDSNGNIYVTDYNRVQKFAPDGTYLDQWGTYGTGAGELRHPWGIAIDASDNIHVVDSDNSRVQIFDADGNYLDQWGSEGPAEGQLDYPRGLGLDGDGNVYVAEFNGHRVQKFSGVGASEATYTGSGDDLRQLALPHGVTLDSGDNVYVTDAGRNRVVTYAADGSSLRAWQTAGPRSSYSGPWAITTDTSDNVYVTITGDDRVQKFDSEGTLLAEWGKSGSKNGQFSNPTGIATDHYGYVYVADYGNDRIQKFDASGTFITKWGSTGSGEGQLRGPHAVAVSSTGHVFVADTGNARIQKFDGDGTFLLSWGRPGHGDGQFSWPRGIAVDRFDNVYVVDGGRIQLFTSNGEFLNTIGTHDTVALEAAAVDRTGTVYSAGVHDLRLLEPRIRGSLASGAGVELQLTSGEHMLSEVLDKGWRLTSVECDGGDPQVDGSTVQLTLQSADSISCTFTNTQPASVCPADHEDVGNQLTGLLGTGMGSLTHKRLVAKIWVPNARDLTDLYGQMAAKEYNGIRFVRFIYPDRSYVQVKPATDEGETAAISWWGADLDENELTGSSYVKGRWFLKKGMRRMMLPRAFVLYPTYQTAEAYANAWSTFNAPGNFVSGTTGFNQVARNALAIPETQAPTDVTVKVAVTDVNRDPRSVDLTIRAGGVEQTVTLTRPERWRMALLNLVEVTLEDVPAGTDQVEIVLTSELGTGDSAALLGATASYACEATE